MSKDEAKFLKLLMNSPSRVSDFSCVDSLDDSIKSQASGKNTIFETKSLTIERQIKGEMALSHMN